jgi:hypothetical protein
MHLEDPVVRRVVRLASGANLLAGAARCSSLDCPMPFVDDDARTADLVHSAASVTAFSCWVALPVMTAVRPGVRWRRQLSKFLAPASVVAFLVAGASTQRRSNRRGLAQRAFLASVFVWYAAMSIHSEPAIPGRSNST